MGGIWKHTGLARRPRATLAALAVTGIALAGVACGDDAGKADKPAETATAAADSFAASEARLERKQRYIHAYGKGTEFEPKPRFPSGPPPPQLVTTDFREGKGAEVEDGDRAVVNYVGYHYATQRKYDTSYGSNPVPYEVTPGAGDFIEGFEEGIVGMKVGGVRQIVIPPDKGYGDRGYHEHVKPGETLVFVVDLERVEKQ